MSNIWVKNFAKRTERMQSSAIRELLKISNMPGVISFAGGLPSPDVFPIERFIEASETVLRQHGDQALQYGTTEGYLPLRQFICDYSAKYGIHVQPENVLITNGSQQALDLIGKVFIDLGDPVLVESPTYIGAIQAWKVYGANFVTVETDKDGMIPESLEAQMHHKPKLAYLLPNFQNPMGTTLPLERREQILKICCEHGVPIIEDDPYGKLRYEGKHIPTVTKLDADICNNGPKKYQGNVIYLSTFSKTLVPGLRLAWAIAPEEIIMKLVQAKQGSDLHTSTFNQYLAHEVCKDDFLDRHIPVIREIYKKRRDLMMELIDELFPSDVHYVRPAGGLFLWVTVPESLNTEELLSIAVDHKVAYVPGSPFHTDGRGKNTMRMNFSNASEEGIRLGMQRLSEVLKTALK
ncbi:MAG: PLP-dependent aminotransferase family protein [Anaerolineales bacterium]|nr:PLP-dependent aminotransferase family protein [Anaerolineales bacterium]